MLITVITILKHTVSSEDSICSHGKFSPKPLPSPSISIPTHGVFPSGGEKNEESGELARNADVKEMAIYLQSLHLDIYANIKAFFKAQHLQSHMGPSEESA